MRDPKRIRRTLKLIEQKWTANPDLRLGQLIINAIANDPFYDDLYNYEDDELELRLAYYLKHGGPAPAILEDK